MGFYCASCIVLKAKHNRYLKTIFLLIRIFYTLDYLKSSGIKDMDWTGNSDA